MKKRLAEESVIFISIIKWLFLATLIGIIAGSATAGFLKILSYGTEQMGRFPYYFLFLPGALFVSGFLIKYLAPDAEGQGTDKVIEAVHKYSGKIKVMVVPVKLMATVVTIAAGGSAGKIGPCAQIGGGLASLFADLLHFTANDRKKIVICGISAGFAAVFGTPIAGAIFGVEVLFVGSILYEVLLPSFVAGLVSYQVALQMGVTYFHTPLIFTPSFSESFFLEVIIAGIYFGICSFIFIEIYRYFMNLSNNLSLDLPSKGLIGGLVLIILSLIFSTKYLGLGFETIQSVLEGSFPGWSAFLLKMIFTSITLNFGGSGGVVVPILFVGATSGALLGQILGASISTFAAIGFVSLLAGATNTPIAASILALELFGPKVAAYAALSCVLSFLMTGHRSIHFTQVLAVKKSASLQVEIGQELIQVEPRIQPREKTILSMILKIAHWWKNKYLKNKSS
ncbi:MAG: chloride channel protein [Thermodesulfobacteriota bacterium]